jgi:lysozyme family protein
MTLAFEKHDAEHQKLWDTMKIIRDQAQLNSMATKVKQHWTAYQAVEKDTGVPAALVAVIHIREGGLQDVGVFAKCLHNGQSWKRKTTIEPIGHGPFKSWHEAAVHALKLKKFNTVTGWTPAKMISAAEPYNGYGYRNMGLRSPYLWASTNHQQRGKYVRDHVFDATVMDTQMGVAAMLKFLGVGSVSTSKPMATKVIKQEGSIVTSTITLAIIFQKYIIPIAIFGAIALGTLWMYRHFKNRKSNV